MVTREPEWDDYHRDRALALAEHDDGCCPGCGLHSSLVGDPEVLLTFDEETCPVCAERERYTRTRNEDHRRADAPVEEKPAMPRSSDGARVVLRPLTEAEARKIQPSDES